MEAHPLHILVALAIVLIDQVTKWWVQARLPFEQSVPVLPPIFYFTYVLNPGAAFTLLAGRRWLLVATAVLVGLVSWFARGYIAKQSALFRWGLTLGLAGATGNLIDRLRFGKVVDFMDVRIWPIFNVADSCIVIGVGLLIWAIMCKKDE